MPWEKTHIFLASMDGFAIQFVITTDLKGSRLDVAVYGVKHRKILAAII